MATYKVKIPFEPVQFATLDSSSVSKLPESFELAGVEISYDFKDAFRASLDVSAPNRSTAKVVAVEKLHEILSLIATWNDAFQINFGLGVEVIVIEGGDIETEESLHIIKEHNLEFENKALSWRDEWPDWLLVALELNYLAVVNHDKRLAFVIHYSALEVLVKALEGNPSSILAQQLRDGQSKQFLGEMEELLSKYGLHDKFIKRITSRIKETQADSIIDRISNALEKLGVKAEACEIRLVRDQRGTFIHRGKSSNTEDFQKAAAKVRNWVQLGLRNILEQSVRV